jgi:putative heme-binding domain-containing protein
MPHKAIATGFETMSVLTGEGKVISGLQVSAGDPVVLKDVNGVVHAVKRDDIDEIVASPVSLMPELGKLLTAGELASLIAFLQETAAEAE